MHKAVEVLIYSIILLSSYSQVMSKKNAKDNSAYIYPDTKWCGAGNISKSYDDLGKAKEADKCCRDHDHCPDYIAAGETKHNLTNDASHTKLSCDCDDAFHKCLRKANTTTSNGVGKVYFDYLGTECYRKDYNVTGCKKYGGLFGGKCLEPIYDKNSTPTYQWFDVSNY